MLNSDCTSELHSFDVSIKALLENEFRTKPEKWMMVSTFNKSEKRQKPKYDVFFQMISETIKKFRNSDNIQRSFKNHNIQNY